MSEQDPERLRKTELELQQATDEAKALVERLSAALEEQTRQREEHRVDAAARRGKDTEPE